MFNVVPQWHPLRLAEDFALADILTGGRMEFGVGRGTVPREAVGPRHRAEHADPDITCDAAVLSGRRGLYDWRTGDYISR